MNKVASGEAKTNLDGELQKTIGKQMRQRREKMHRIGVLSMNIRSLCGALRQDQGLTMLKEKMDITNNILQYAML